jgi:hypothetical protein
MSGTGETVGFIIKVDIRECLVVVIEGEDVKSAVQNH